MGAKAWPYLTNGHIWPHYLRHRQLVQAQGIIVVNGYPEQVAEGLFWEILPHKLLAAPSPVL